MKQTILYTWKLLLRRERKKFLLLALADLLVNIADILSLAALLFLVRFYIGESALPSLFQGRIAADDNWPVFVFLGIFAGKNALAFIIAKNHYRFSAEVSTRLAQQQLRKYQLGDYKNFVEENEASHIRSIAFQPFEFGQYVLSGLQQLITQCSLVLIAAVAIAWFNAQLFLLLLLVLLPPALLASYLVRRKLRVLRRSITEANQLSFRHLLDALKGWVEGNVYGGNKSLEDRYAASRGWFGRSLFDTVAWQTLPARFIELFAVAGLLGLIVLVRWQGQAGPESFIILGAFLAAVYKIIPGLVKIINTAAQLKAHGNTVRSLQKSIEIRPAQFKESVHSIRLDNISFHYDQQRIIQNLNLELERGDFVGISGASGTGKTSLLHLLLGFRTPVSGSISVNNKRSATALQPYWSAVAYLQQRSFLLNDTILRNITLSDDPVDEERLHTALKISGLDRIIRSLEDGLQHIIAENGKNISGGQQQRLCMARALYKKADVLLLDEPFNELDEKAEQELLQHLSLLAATGTIIVMISHHAASLSYCSKIISMEPQAAALQKMLG